jgi:hypothetical protein
MQSDENFHPAGEGPHQRQHLLLGDKTWRPRRDVNHAQAVAKVDNGLQAFVVAAREDVNAMAVPRQMARNLCDIDILSAAIHAPKRAQR